MANCDVCGKRLKEPTPEQKAAAQMALLDYFGNIPLEECAVTCTQCYLRIREWLEYGSDETIH
jgi:hypothetical protein